MPLASSVGRPVYLLGLEAVLQLQPQRVGLVGDHPGGPEPRPRLHPHHGVAGPRAQLALHGVEALLLHGSAGVASLGHVGGRGGELLVVHGRLLVYHHGGVLGELVRLNRLTLREGGHANGFAR